MKENKIEKVDFVKLDLEGAEYDAILGFKDFLKERKIRAFQFEYGLINISTKKLLLDFYSLLNEHGYILGKIYPKVVEFREYSYMHEDFLGPNFIAVHKDDRDLIAAFSSK